jgi:hypothetical protein
MNDNYMLQHRYASKAEAVKAMIDVTDATAQAFALAQLMKVPDDAEEVHVHISIYPCTALAHVSWVPHVVSESA